MLLRAFLALVLLAPASVAQCFNVDFGDAFGVPSPTYGAAAGQPGVWQAVLPALGQDFPLVDTSGAATGVTMRFHWGPLSSSGTGGGDREPTGDDEKLVDDWWQIDSNDYGTLFRVRFKGLEPGTYRVYTYSWWNPNPLDKTKVEVLRGALWFVYSGGGAWPSGHSMAGFANETGTYIVDRTTTFDGRLRVDLHAVSFPSHVNGIQLVKVDSCPSTNHETYCSQPPVGDCSGSVLAGGFAQAQATASFDIALIGAPPKWDAIGYFSIQGRTSTPWQGGPTLQCAQPPLQRVGVVPAGITVVPCSGYYRMDFNAWMAANPSKAPPPGTQVQFQFWLNDPANPGATTGLSEALEFTLAP